MYGQMITSDDIPLNIHLPLMKKSATCSGKDDNFIQTQNSTAHIAEFLDKAIDFFVEL